MGLSTHILDTALGKPATGVSLALAREDRGSWLPQDTGITDADGRCTTLLAKHPLVAGMYRLRFETHPYFANQSIATLYPFVEIVFTVADPTQHFHIPLLIAANGYTTYRGS